MTTAVDHQSTTGAEANMNGHRNGALNGDGVNGDGINGDGVNNDGVNGDGFTVDSREWEELFLPPPLELEDKVREQKVRAALAALVLDGGDLRRVARAFTREVAAGLAQQPSSLQMENTYVPELPDGTEEGVFLALDLGGTNFRILLLELQAGTLVREDVKHYHISDELRLGPGIDLFNFLADCVLDFLKSEGMENESLSLGFTFSFPMKQHSISSGELITWTKSFKCSGLQGVDVAALLQRCLDARRLRVRVRVLLNDTTGTLVAGAQRDPRVAIGVILGTGSNGCYMERAARVAHWEAEHTRVRDVCVDVEWGAFGDNGCIDFIKTPLDALVDQHSLLANSFTFEKYIGGKYLGAVASAALAALGAAGLFPAAPPLSALTTAHLSLFEREWQSGGTALTLQELRAALPPAPPPRAAPLTAEDARVAQHVALLVSNRAAQLVSVCIASLLQRVSRPLVCVAVDGSVYKRHPRIAALMRRYIALLAPHHPFILLDAEDGSGKGSALTAAIAARLAARDAAAERR